MFAPYGFEYRNVSYLYNLLERNGLAKHQQAISILGERVYLCFPMSIDFTAKSHLNYSSLKCSLGNCNQAEAQFYKLLREITAPFLQFISYFGEKKVGLVLNINGLGLLKCGSLLRGEMRDAFAH